MNTTVLAATQGLRNGLLFAGLMWALIAGPTEEGRDVAPFFLPCVIVAGLFGATTISRRIVYVRTLPAALALGAVLAGV